MPHRDRRRFLPGGLASLAGLACALCCVLPLLLAAGVLGGVGWAAAGKLMPGLTVVLLAAAGATWWWIARRRRHHYGPECSCSATSKDGETHTIRVRSGL